MVSIPPRITYIYGLIDPRTNELRYIGKSDKPRVRYIKHINDKATNHKCSWIKQLRKAKLLPWLIILDVVSLDQWQQYESDWIECFRERITNIAHGGLGVMAVSDETRQKMSLAKKGKVPHNKGKLTPDSIRQKQSVAAILRHERMSDDDRKALGLRLNKNRTPDSYKHLKGRRHTAEARKKISNALIGNKKTALLNKEQVLEIVDLINCGTIQLKDIGAMYGVGIQTISNIKHGRSYTDWTKVK